MTELLADPKKEAAKRRNKALAAWTSTAGVGGLTAAPAVLIGAGAVVSGWLTFKWLKHRAQWGLRF